MNLFGIPLHGFVIPSGPDPHIWRRWGNLFSSVILKMRLCLRTIFEKSSSDISLTTIRRAATLTLASLLALSTPSSTVNNDNFYKILLSLPDKATPFQSANLPSNSSDNFYQMTFSTALENFRHQCPAMPKDIDTDRETIGWVYKHFKDYPFAETPLPFRDSAYGLIATFNESPDKNALLTNLNSTLPDSKILMEYLEQKRIEISQRLRADPDIQKVAPHWNNITDTEIKRATLAKISKITLDTLLPNKDIDYPEIVWNMHDLKSSTYAMFWNDVNQIQINGRLDPTNFTFEFATDMAIHESVHAFQSMLVNWGMRGYLRGTPDVERFARLLYANQLEGIGAIRYNPHHIETSIQYFLTKTEAMSWGFSVIGDTIRNPYLTKTLEGTLERDMYTVFDARAPRLRERHMPLLETPLSKMDNSPTVGVLPQVCLEK